MELFKPERIIDVHTHVFNALYLPLEGIFRDKFGVNDFAAKALQNILFFITEKDDIKTIKDRKAWTALIKKPYSEDIILDEMFSMIRKRFHAELRSYFFEDHKSALPNLYSDLLAIKKYAETSQALSDDDLAGIQDELAAFGKDAAQGLFKKKFNKQFRNPFKTVMNIVANIAAKAMKQPEMVSSYVKFVAILLQGESKIIKELFTSYTEDDNVRLFVHHMMDMEKAYDLKPDRGPYYPFLTGQIPRVRELAHKANGKLLGFVAFDPRRGDAALAHVEAGLRQGCLGVKFYPPLGYRPDPFFPQQKKVFEFCVERDIPLLTHCTPLGFEAKKCLGYHADPANWACVLQRFPTLRLCLGHAGGGHFELDCPEGAATKEIHYGWLADNAHWDNDNYAKKVVDLCVAHDNVYCDFSHLVEVYDGRMPFGQDERTPMEVVRDRLITVLRAQSDFSKKIMYGSDWHMARILSGGLDNYLTTFQAIFGHPGLKPYGEDFFYRNALRFLDLPGYLRRYREYGVPVFSDSALAYLGELDERN